MFWEPATSAGSEPTKAQFTSTTADSLKVTMVKPEGVEAATWAKFDYLLNSYKGVEFPFSNNDPKNKVVADQGTDTAIVIIRQDMKDYILGAAGNKAGSQKYSWVDSAKVSGKIGRAHV